MRTHVHISGLPSIHENSNLIAELRAIHPHGAKSNSFQLDLPEEDPRTTAVTEVLARHGCYPRTNDGHARDRAIEYFIDYYREYDDADLDGVAIIRPSPWDTLPCRSGNDRDAQGRIQIEFHKPHLPKIPIANGDGSILVCEHVKQIIDSVNPKHLWFRETGLVAWWDEPPRQLEWASLDEEPWWEVMSDLLLPPMAPSMTLLDVNTFEHLPCGTDQMCFARDPDEPRDREAQLHFCRNEVDRLGPFDAALTHEHIGSSHQLVFSGRVYRTLYDAGIQSRWIPCKLDDC